MKKENKFGAAKRYDAGARFALFHDCDPTFEDPLFMAGYNFVHDALKDLIFEDRNKVLKQYGFEAIGIIKLAKTGA